MPAPITQETLEDWLNFVGLETDIPTGGLPTTPPLDSDEYRQFTQSLLKSFIGKVLFEVAQGNVQPGSTKVDFQIDCSLEVSDDLSKATATVACCDRYGCPDCSHSVSIE